VAAGNSAYDFDYAPAPDTPAAYPEAVTVTAMGDTDGSAGAAGAAPSCRTGEADDRYASFSNYAATAGGRAHTLAAPGVCIRSSYPRSLSPADPHAVMSGTSMATPHVAGTIALCKGEVGVATAPVCGLTETSPATLIPKITSTEPTYGFAGDPSQPVSGRYFGYLALAGTPPPPSPSFTLAASPSSRSVRRGQSTTYAITITPANGFSGPVTLSVTGLRSGASASFSPNPASTTSTLAVTTTSRATRGTSTLTITGRSGSLTRTTTVTLAVT
jgi:subtilisin family serine protease